MDYIYETVVVLFELDHIHPYSLLLDKKEHLDILLNEILSYICTNFTIVFLSKALQVTSRDFLCSNMHCKSP